MSTDEQNPQTPKLTILFIDDEQDIRKLIRFILERQGYRVLTAENGAVGLAMSTTEHPDVILLDLMMPTMNGHEVLRRLKANPVTQDIPVIVLTAMGADKDAALSLELGAVSHMEKPYQAKELMEEIKIAVWKHHNVHPQAPAAPSTPSAPAA